MSVPINVSTSTCDFCNPHQYLPVCKILTFGIGVNNVLAIYESRGIGRKSYSADGADANEQSIDVDRKLDVIGFTFLVE